MNEQRTDPVTVSVQDIHQPREQPRPSSDLVEYVRQYARERPGTAVLVCLGIGFVLGWKLKPW